MSIKFYKTKDPHGHMSNFYRSKFYWNGIWWKTSEHAYQAAKTCDYDEIVLVRDAKTPRIARDIGQTVELKPHFDHDKYEIMKEIVREKYLQNRDLLDKLIETGDEFLIEDSPVDYYWGCGADGTGKNRLGLVLMEVREEFSKGYNGY